MSTPSALVQKLWNYCNILRDDGLSYGDYVEQLTFLLFLKMADEQANPPFNKPSPIPKGFGWDVLLKLDGDEVGSRRCTFGQKLFFDEGKHTSNRASISRTKLKGLPVPILPLAEQTRIAADVEQRLRVVEELEAVVSANLQRATRLRHAVLHRAFSGGLTQCADERLEAAHEG
jgi:HsdM N-terminal domain